MGLVSLVVRWMIQDIMWLHRLLSSRIDCPASIHQSPRRHQIAGSLWMQKLDASYQANSTVARIQKAGVQRLKLLRRQPEPHKKSGV